MVAFAVTASPVRRRIAQAESETTHSARRRPGAPPPAISVAAGAAARPRGHVTWHSAKVERGGHGTSDSPPLKDCSDGHRGIQSDPRSTCTRIITLAPEWVFSKLNPLMH